MSRIIRCPSCAAVYEVEVSQIQVAQGWFRCGKCHEAFNATGLDLPSPTVLLPNVSASLTLPVAAEPSAQANSRLELDDLLLREDVSGRSAAPTQDISADLMAFSEALSTFKPAPPNPEPAAAAHRDKGAAASRVFLHTSAVVLGLLLMGQLFLVQRHAMAAFWPSSLHVLESLCRPFQCQVEPWRNPKALVMEEASFAQSGDQFLLTWSLRNVSAMTVATTSLELSLLDEFNNPVVRRVLLSEETQAPVVLSPGQVWKGSWSVHVDPSLVFSQYRLMTFYP
jgi:predicted Zn finger-like uncharacterized protein